MQIEAHLDAETIKRLEEQSKLLLRMYHAEFAKQPRDQIFAEQFDCFEPHD